MGTEQPGRCPVKNCPEFGQVVFDRCTCQGNSRAGRDGANRLRPCRTWVFHVLGFIRDQQAPSDGSELQRIKAHRSVSGQNEALPDAIQRASTAVVAPNFLARSKASDLPLPVSQERRRTDNQRRARCFFVPLAVQVKGDEHHGLTKSHVICQAAAEAKGGHSVQPPDAFKLVRAERRIQRGRLLGWLAGSAFPGDLLTQLGEPPCGLDFYGAPIDDRAARQSHAEGVDCRKWPQIGIASPLGFNRWHKHPLLPQPGDRTVVSGEFHEFGRTEWYPVEVELPGKALHRSFVKNLWNTPAESSSAADHNPCLEGPVEIGIPGKRNTRAVKPLCGTVEQVLDLVLARALILASEATHAG